MEYVIICRKSRCCKARSDGSRSAVRRVARSWRTREADGPGRAKEENPAGQKDQPRMAKSGCDAYREILESSARETHRFALVAEYGIWDRLRGWVITRSTAVSLPPSQWFSKMSAGRDLSDRWGPCSTMWGMFALRHTAARESRSRLWRAAQPLWLQVTKWSPKGSMTF